MCNNYSSAAFMESEANECTQILDLITDCETTLNAKFYTDYLRVLEGQALSSNQQTVQIKTAYQLKKNADNPDIMEYAQTDLAGGTVNIASVLDSSGNPTYTCKNILKEIAYTVEVTSVDEPAPEDSNQAYLKITAISADIVLQDPTELVTAVVDA